MVLVDSTRPETFRETLRIIDFFNSYRAIPYVVAANKQDQEDAWKPDEVRLALRLPREVKVLPLHRPRDANRSRTCCWNCSTRFWPSPKNNGRRAPSPRRRRNLCRPGQMKWSRGCATCKPARADIEAAAVVSVDGLIMASALPRDVEEDRVSAMSAAMLSLGERIAIELGRGTLDQVFIRGEQGYVLLHVDRHRGRADRAGRARRPGWASCSSTCAAPPPNCSRLI